MHRLRGVVVRPLVIGRYKGAVARPTSPQEWQSCKSVEQLNPLLARLIVKGRLLSLVCDLVQFLSLSQINNASFLLYARRLVLVNMMQQQQQQHTSTSTFLWNTIIKGYSRSTQFPQQALFTYSTMLHYSIKPDNFTFPFLVKAAAKASSSSSSSLSTIQGHQVHAHILITGFNSNVFVLNTLLNMYSLFQDMDSAQNLFDSSNPNLLDIVSWNTLIHGYVKFGALHMARRLFDKMPHPNQISWTSIISAYANTGHLDVAQSLFDTMPISKNTVTWNSMISGFAKSGFLSLARNMFDHMPQRNIVSWNTMISAYAHHGHLHLARSLFDLMPQRDVFSWTCIISGYAQSQHGAKEALNLFKHMLHHTQIRPNEVTLVSVLSVCGHLAALDQGKWIHSYIKRNGMRLSHNLGAALIDMYAKCGCVETAVQVFCNLGHRNTSTWNALITGLAINGDANGALQAFVEMQRSEEKPNSITFLGVLMACCHGGLVAEGRHHFKGMLKSYGVQPEMKHYGCMVDLLGRAGLLEEAEEIVKSMPMKPDVMVLGALIGACRIHGNVEVADRLRKHFLELKSSEAGCHVLLSNIYAAAGKWVDAFNMRGMLDINQIKKEAGFSSVELSESENKTNR